MMQCTIRIYCTFVHKQKPRGAAARMPGCSVSLAVKTLVQRAATPASVENDALITTVSAERQIAESAACERCAVQPHPHPCPPLEGEGLFRPAPRSSILSSALGRAVRNPSRGRKVVA